jgi:hypothetical protein
MYTWGEGLYADFVQLESDMRWEGKTFRYRPENLQVGKTKKSTG